MPKSRKAPHGERMIEVKVRFFTDGIAKRKGEVISGHGWTKGVVRLTPNETHTIDKNNRPIPFNSLMEIPFAIEKLLMRDGITLFVSKKYLRELQTRT